MLLSKSGWAPAILVMTFMGRISRNSQRVEGLKMSSQLFADDVVILAPSGDGPCLLWGGLQLSVKQQGWESSLRPWFSDRKLNSV